MNEADAKKFLGLTDNMTPQQMRMRMRVIVRSTEEKCAEFTEQANRFRSIADAFPDEMDIVMEAVAALRAAVEAGSTPKFGAGNGGFKSFIVRFATAARASNEACELAFRVLQRMTGDTPQRRLDNVLNMLERPGHLPEQIQQLHRMRMDLEQEIREEAMRPHPHPQGGAVGHN